jgi:hypothetical protein
MDKYSKMGEYKSKILGLKPSVYKRDGFFFGYKQKSDL